MQAQEPEPTVTTEPPTTTAPPTTAPVPTAAPTTAPTLPQPTPARPNAAAPVIVLPSPAPTAATTTPTIPGPVVAQTSDWGTPALIGGLAALAVLAVVLAIVAATKLRRKPSPAIANWSVGVRAALVDVDLTDEMALAHAQTPDPRPFGQVLAPRFRELRGRLDSLSAQAPDPLVGQQVANVADSLQSFAFATEAEWMLREAPMPPTAEQLTAAGAATAERHAALEQSVGAVRASLDSRPLS